MLLFQQLIVTQLIGNYNFFKVPQGSLLPRHVIVPD